MPADHTNSESSFAVAAVVGGFVAWAIAASQGGYYGGRPVGLALGGHVLVALVGAVGSMAVHLLAIELTRAKRDSVRTGLAVVLGVAAGPASVMVLGFTFLTVPHPWYRFLLDVS